MLARVVLLIQLGHTLNNMDPQMNLANPMSLGKAQSLLALVNAKMALPLEDTNVKLDQFKLLKDQIKSKL